MLILLCNVLKFSWGESTPPGCAPDVITATGNAVYYVKYCACFSRSCTVQKTFILSAPNRKFSFRFCICVFCSFNCWNLSAMYADLAQQSLLTRVSCYKPHNLRNAVDRLN